MCGDENFAGSESDRRSRCAVTVGDCGNNVARRSAVPLCNNVTGVSDVRVGSADSGAELGSKDVAIACGDGLVDAVYINAVLNGFIGICNDNFIKPDMVARTGND